MRRFIRNSVAAGSVLSLLLILSQLSVGPMAWLHGRGLISENAAGRIEKTLYLPLNVAAQFSPMCDRTVRYYVAFWEPTIHVPSSPGPYPNLQYNDLAQTNCRRISDGFKRWPVQTSMNNADAPQYVDTLG